MQDEIPNPGSTISLISSAQVRYEGVLETIQMRPDESSITLANVLQYGTEGRPAAKFVPASPSRFESICFKGADIISLDVKEYYHEPPKQQPRPLPPSQVPYAEAPQRNQQSDVYHNQAPYNDAPRQYSQPENASLWGPPSAPDQQAANTWAPPSSAQQPQPAQYAPPSAPPAPQQAGPWQGAAPAPTVVVTPSMASRPQAQPRVAAPRASGWSNTTTANALPKRGEGFQSQPVPGATAGSAPTQAGAGSNAAKPNAGPPPGFAGPPPGMQGGAGPSPQQQPAHPATALAPDSGYPKANGRAEGGRGRGRGRRGGRGDRPHGGRDSRGPGGPQAPPVPVPHEDFNFEDNLSKFDKDKIKDEADYGEAVEDASPAAPAYNPEEDFFDALSSDLSSLSTKERPQRVPFSEQRKMDMETFGGSGVARRPMRGGRGRGRRGGRGRGRGGRDQNRPVAVAT